MTIRLVTLTLRTRYRPVRLPVQTVRCCLRKSNTASKVAKHRDLPSPVGKETKTSLPCRNSLTALSWSVVAAAYPRVRKACLMASFTSSTATPLASSLGISMIDARRTPLVITRSDASFSGNLIGQNDIVLQCQAFRLNVPDHLSSPIKNGDRKWTGDETTNLQARAARYATSSSIYSAMSVSPSCRRIIMLREPGSFEFSCIG